MSDGEKEHLEVDATNGEKDAVLELIDVVKQAAEWLPDDRRYNIYIEYEEVESE